MRNNFVDNLIWIILFILLVPSGLVIASWNSLPGSHLYAMKIAAENVLLALAPTQQAKGELEVAYTERRFSEATTLLNNGSSVEGLANFRSQAEAAKEAIQKAPPGAARNQLAQKYILSLENASAQLEQQKQTYAYNRTTGVNSQQPATNQAPTNNQAPVINEQRVVQVINNNTTTYIYVTPTPAQNTTDSSSNVSSAIDQTQGDINTIIGDLNGTDSTQSIPSVPTITAPPPVMPTVSAGGHKPSNYILKTYDYDLNNTGKHN